MMAKLVECIREIAKIECGDASENVSKPDCDSCDDSCEDNVCCEDGDADSCCGQGSDSDCDSCEEEGKDNCCDKSTSSYEACATHFQKALKDYYKYIETGQCICRKFFKNLNTCCGTKVSGPSIYQDHDECFVKSSCSRKKSFTPRCRSRRKVKSSCGEKGGNEDICKDSCEETKENSCKDACCKIKETPLKFSESKDPESLTSYEAVAFNVSGMTCTGCSKKVLKVLQNIEGISSINVTFVTGIAEFTINKDILDVPQAVARISKETGFKLTKIEYDFQTIDMIIGEGDLNKLEEFVESIEKLDKSTYRVSYDPQFIGARSLVSKIPGSKLAPPKFNKALEEGKKKLRLMWIKCALSLALAIPVVVLDWSHNSVPYATKSIVSLVLASLVQIIAIPEFYIGALKALIYSKVLEMDMLIVISITAAYVFSLVIFILKRVGVSISINEFFETSSLLIALVLVGRLLSEIAKVKAVSSISLRSLQIETSILLQDGDEIEIDSRLLEMNDKIVISPHSRVVTDGFIVSGEGPIDESMITGECLPVMKKVNDEVIAGTFNGSSKLIAQVTRLPGKNSITDIAESVENALAEKPKVQDLADKIAGYFIPVVIMISTIVFIVWIIVGLKVRHQSGGKAVSVAITYGIAVLAISCPCAIGLAVPMVLIIAGGVAAREGIIIKQSNVLENAYKVTDVVFDKTGTLTDNEMRVEDFKILEDNGIENDEVISVVKQMTLNNTHPVSVAVANFLDQKDASSAAKIEKIESISGSGIQCEFKHSILKLGNPYWTKLHNHEVVKPLLEKGYTLLCCASDSKLICVFSLRTELKPEAKDVIQFLSKKGQTCHIVSGDNRKSVEMVANELGISLSNIQFRATPKSKQAFIKSLKGASKEKVVLFCGDGTNDAIAVAQADIGVQIGTASEVTKASSDVILLGGLDGIVKLQSLSKRTFNRVFFNFIWSAIYNLFAILLSSGAFVKARIPPAYSGIGEIVSIAPVVLAAISLSIKWKKE